MESETDIQKYDSLSTAICAVTNSEVTIIKTERVSGGDINRAYALTLSNGEKIFMKANVPENVRFFACEAHGLFALAGAATVANVAKPLAYGVETSAGKNLRQGEKSFASASDGTFAGVSELSHDAFSFLLLEYIESGHRNTNYWQNFGHELATLHLADCGTQFGFFEDNYIGATAQINSPHSTWIDFFRECRLLPQIKMAERYFDAAFLRKCDAFLSHLENYISEPKQPSLLHGDLWGGNVMCGTDGKAWLIDPAVYVGHFEADLAMTQLFGSFPRMFYDAYSEINPIEKDYASRREIYNLYQLLNHLNLFGAGYLGEVQSIIHEYS